MADMIEFKVHDVEERPVKDEFMGWWQPALLPILDQMAAAADGSPDADFWRGICQTTETYGSRVVGGWVTRLFPYAVGRDRSARNPMVVGWGDPACPKPTIERVKTHPDGRAVYDAETGDVVQEAVEVDGLWPHMVPQGLSCADVSLVDETVSPHGEHQFRLVGGLVGIEVDDGFMRPRAGWAAARVGKT